MRNPMRARSRWSLFAVLVAGLSVEIAAVADSLSDQDRPVKYSKHFSFDIANGSGPTAPLL
jgi:hypothetical protein